VKQIFWQLTHPIQARRARNYLKWLEWQIEQRIAQIEPKRREKES